MCVHIPERSCVFVHTNTHDNAYVRESFAVCIRKMKTASVYTVFRASRVTFFPECLIELELPPGWVFGVQLGLRQTQALIKTKTIRRGKLPPAILLFSSKLLPSCNIAGGNFPLLIVLVLISACVCRRPTRLDIPEKKWPGWRGKPCNNESLCLQCLFTFTYRSHGIAKLGPRPPVYFYRSHCIVRPWESSEAVHLTLEEFLNPVS